MISGIQVVNLFVSDQDKALDFFVNKLGFEQRSDNPMGDGLRWVTVAPPGENTVIILANGFGGWSEDRVGGFAGIVFGSDDVQKTYDELSSRGVTFTEEPTRQPWGAIQAQFVDDDGNGFVLHENID